MEAGGEASSWFWKRVSFFPPCLRRRLNVSTLVSSIDSIGRFVCITGRVDVARQQNEPITASYRVSAKRVLITGRKEIHPREAGLSPSSIRLLSLCVEVAEKFNYLSPTSLNLLSFLSQTYELEFLSTLKQKNGGPAGCRRGRWRVFDVVRRGKVISIHLHGAHALCAQREGPHWTVSNSFTWSRNAKQVKSSRHQEETCHGQCSGAPEQLDSDGPFWWLIFFFSL